MSNAKVRVQLDLEAAEVEALDALRASWGLRSRADAVRTALAVLEWMQNEVSWGRSVVAVGDDFISHLALPRLNVYSEKRRRSRKEET